MLQRLSRLRGTLYATSSVIQRPTSVLPLPPSRNVHSLPVLQNNDLYAQHGISEFMSKEAFDFSWTQYQSFMIDKLNLLTQDTVDADKTPMELLVKYSKRPEMAALFNYASMAHNNHFYFSCLSPTEVAVPEMLGTAFKDTCSSIESLKLDFLATASAMFGPGFVWLGKNLDKEGMVHIYCTYNAGSPYPAAFARRQETDMSTGGPNISTGNQYAGAMGAHSRNRRLLALGAVDIQPILCVNTWEHAWMMDYGIAGKDEFLERWWKRINWNVVADNYNAIAAAPRLSTWTQLNKATVRAQGL